MSVATSHLRLLDRVVTVRLSDCLEWCDLEHERFNPNHALETALLQVRAPARLSRLAV